MFTSLRTGSVVLHCISNVLIIQCLYTVISDFTQFPLGTNYLLFILLLIASSLFRGEFVTFYTLNPNQLRFTESEKDFLFEFITIQINVIKEKSFLILCHHHYI